MWNATFFALNTIVKCVTPEVGKLELVGTRFPFRDLPYLRHLHISQRDTAESADVEIDRHLKIVTLDKLALGNVKLETMYPLHLA